MSEPQKSSEDKNPEKVFPVFVFPAAGLAFLITTIFLFTVVIIRPFEKEITLKVGNTSLSVDFNFIIIFSAWLCAVIGIRLLRAAGIITRAVIPREEFDLLAKAIEHKNHEAISEYIRLSSLSGLTGFFTKIDLTGLPLATIVLTIILAFMGFYEKKFFDLAQLTLGAFIGSYVQKKREEPSSPAGVIKK